MNKELFRANQSFTSFDGDKIILGMVLMMDEYDLPMPPTRRGEGWTRDYWEKVSIKELYEKEREGEGEDLVRQTKGRK